MKVALVGAFGNLGFEILKKLALTDNELVALDLKEKESELKGRYTFKEIDATNVSSLEGVFEGCDVVISTVGLTTSSTKFSCYDIDYQGNVNIYNEAKKANVKKFVYTSVIACDHKDAKKVPMLNSKKMFEDVLKSGDIEYVIHRPTGYFYDIIKVFRPYIEKGEMQLLKGFGGVKANVVDCPDFAQFIVDTMNETNKVFEVGGKETYTYEEMAKMCFESAGKEVVIKYVPKFMFSILANLPKIKKLGKRDVILFSQFTLSHDLVGHDEVGDASFKEYIDNAF
jgi:nucleoside-diphosphate-sugar epimerase